MVVDMVGGWVGTCVWGFGASGGCIRRGGGRGECGGAKGGHEPRFTSCVCIDTGKVRVLGVGLFGWAGR